MKFFLPSILLFLLFNQVTQSQVKEYNPVASSMQILEKKDTSSKEIEGSSYFESEFLPGVLLQKNKRSNQFYFRYNALKKQVEIKLKPKDDKSYVLPYSFSDIYELEDYSYQIRSLNLGKDGIKTSYFLIYYESEDLLFIGKPRLNLTKEVKKKSGFGANKPARHEVEIDWYFKKDNGSLSKIDLKERDFKIYFDSKKMKDYFDAHKIKNEMDVVKMLEFYANNKS